MKWKKGRWTNRERGTKFWIVKRETEWSVLIWVCKIVKSKKELSLQKYNPLPQWSDICFFQSLFQIFLKISLLSLSTTQTPFSLWKQILKTKLHTCHVMKLPTCQAKLLPNGTQPRGQMSHSGSACTPFLYYKRLFVVKVRIHKFTLTNSISLIFSWVY